MRFNQIIENISNSFNEAWNQWRIEEMGNFMTDNIELHSPKIVMVHPDNTKGVIKGKGHVLSYWTKLAEITGKFKVNKLKTIKLQREVLNYNEILDSNIVIKETLKLDEYGKIFYLKYEYVDRDAVADELT